MAARAGLGEGVEYVLGHVQVRLLPRFMAAQQAGTWAHAVSRPLVGPDGY